MNEWVYVICSQSSSSSTPNHSPSRTLGKRSCPALERLKTISQGVASNGCEADQSILGSKDLRVERRCLALEGLEPLHKSSRFGLTGSVILEE